MKYKYESGVMIAALFCFSLAPLAAADSVVKTIYVDGILVDTSTADAALTAPYDHILIGAEGNIGYRYNELLGKIDEFAVYEGILSETRIAAHYNAVLSGYVTEVLSDNPLLYLRFEDPNSSDGFPAYNSGSVPIHGIYIDNVELSAGIVGKAALFHGPAPDGAGDCIDIPDGNQDFSPQDVTVEVWVNTTQAGTSYPRLFQHNGGWTSTGGYGVLISDPNQFAVTGGGVTDYISYILNDGNWHHIVVTYDSTVEQIETDTYPNEVMADNPVLYLRFEGETPLDSSGYNHWVAYDTGVQFRPALGMGDCLYLPDDPRNAVAAANQQTRPASLSQTGDQFAFSPDDITFEFWMKSTSMEPYGMFFQQIDMDETKAPGIGNSNGTLRVLNGTGIPNQGWWYTGVATPLNDRWHQIVVTYDEAYQGDPNSMMIQLFVDGNLMGSRLATPNAKLGPELSTLVIGGENNFENTWNNYQGLIDEFSVYAGVLSAERIAIHYAAGVAELMPDTCAEAWLKGLGLAADTDKDCDVDMEDFAAFAAQWLLCNDPMQFGVDPACGPTWLLP